MTKEYFHALFRDIRIEIARGRRSHDAHRAAARDRRAVHRICERRGGTSVASFQLISRTRRCTTDILSSVTYKWAKRIAVSIVGFTVLAVGIAMIVLPGPAFVVIPIGLGILGLEFAWARRWLRKVKERGASLVGTFRSNGKSSAPAGRSPGETARDPPNPL